MMNETMAINAIASPIAIFNGLSENEISPSIATFIDLKKLYLVTPASRWFRCISIAQLLKPGHSV